MSVFKDLLVLVFFFMFFYSLKVTAQTSEVIHPEWSKNATIYEVNVRQYSEEGTFKAFEKNLPKLKEMGIDIENDPKKDFFKPPQSPFPPAKLYSWGGGRYVEDCRF